jgi:pimeloyl-ACP methyl ester carboxylesterase
VHAPRGPIRRLSLILLTCVALIAAACSDSGDTDDRASGADDPTTTTTTTPEGPPAEPEQFTGTVDEFYVVPEPLPPGEPGDLIRMQPVKAEAGHTTLRIMYHSRDAQDQDRAVTGIVTFPNAAPPAEGWPVVSLGNGTVGLASPCALSRQGRTAPTFGVEGVGVVTDYIGLGPVGERHPYLSKPSEGHSVIDAVRAARNLPASGAGTRWLAIGHSQGGHAALSTHELGEAYAPELDLLGTISVAPAALFDRTFEDDVVVRIVGVMALYGAASEHPEIDPDDYVGPKTAAAAEALDDQCGNAVTQAFLTVPGEDFYEHLPTETEPARSILLENDVGDVKVDAPLLLISGSADPIVVVDRVRELYSKLCDTGQVTEYLELEGADHGTEYAMGNDRIEAWMAERVAGEPPEDSCND